MVGLFHDLVAAQGAVGLAGKQGQQVEFGGADLDVAALRIEEAVLVQIKQALAEGHALCGGGIDGGGIRSFCGRGCHLNPPQHGPHACQQFTQVKGFGQVVVGAEFKAHHAVNRLAHRGEHDQARMGMGLAEPACQRQAVFAGHVHVQQHDVGNGLGHAEPGRGGIGGGAHGETVAGEVFAEYRAQIGLVVDHHQHGVCRAIALHHGLPSFACSIVVG